MEVITVEEKVECQGRRRSQGCDAVKTKVSPISGAGRALQSCPNGEERVEHYSSHPQTQSGLRLQALGGKHDLGQDGSFLPRAIPRKRLILRLSGANIPIS